MNDYTEFLTPAQLAIEESAWASSRLYARNAQAVIDTLNRDAKAPRTVVELGCGTGWVARQVLPEVDSYLGVDKHHTEVEMARAKCDREASGLPNSARFVRADVREFARVGDLPTVACAFAFIKHFGEVEWWKIIRTLFACTARFAVFEINISGSGAFMDDGPLGERCVCGIDQPPHDSPEAGHAFKAARIFAHLWVPESALLMLIELLGFKIIEMTTLTACPQGWEKMVIVERDPATPIAATLPGSPGPR